MNERIKELAVQADLLIKKSNGAEFRYGILDPKLQKFAELIRADEREACAKVCEEWGAWNDTAQDCAEAIRNRGEVK